MRPIFVCALLSGLLLSTAACVAPMSPAERLAYSAHDLNAATRFGRMDVALGHVEEDEQVDFARRHRKWHRSVRIVDLEVQGVHMLAAGEAEVQLSVAWHHLDETIIRRSMVAQLWKQGGRDWSLTEEKRTGGAPGLFARPQGKKKKRVPRPDQLNTEMGQL
jgi:hypothetical protein